MNRTKVSVISATFNLIKNGREAYFRQMLESVRKQTYENVEHIIVDGGSTDGTLDIIEEYADMGWIKYISEPDKGIYDAMNKGAALAKGELITFLNSDDFMHNTKGLERAVKVIDEGFDYTYCHIRVLDVEKDELSHGRIKKSRLLRNMPFPHPGMVLKKEVFDRFGGFDISFKLVGDYDFILRIMLAGVKGQEIGRAFVTFRSGGATDVYADKHKAEMERLYFKNYGELAGLSQEDCRKIAVTYIFPMRLLKVLWTGNYSREVKMSVVSMWIRSLKRKLWGESYQNEPLVTVVTVTFNTVKGGRTETFRQCVESVHNQNYKNIEHLVIDGGSADGSLDLIKEYAEKGWIRYISEPDDGIYEAMNKGLRMAAGKYVIFLNSDDYWHDFSGIKASVRRLEAEKADFSYAPVYFRDERTQKSELKKTHMKSVFRKMPFCHQTMLARTEVLRSAGGFDEKFKSAADYDLILRLVLNGCRSVKVSRVFTTFRLGGESCQNKDLSIAEQAKVLYKNYNPLAGTSLDDCEKIVRRGIFPKNLKKELCKKSGLKSGFFSRL